MSCLTVVAQQMKFGKPTDEELKMTVYEPDSSAEAVVLCKLTDVGYTIQQSSFLVDYKEKFRIKVLKPEGARFAKVVIPYQQYVSINNIGGTKLTGMALPKPGGSSDSYFEGEGVSMMEGVFGTDADDIVEDIKRYCSLRIKPEFRNCILEKFTDGCRMVVVSDAHTHIERLVFPGFCIDGKWGGGGNEIDGKHTFMIDGGDPASVYADEVYLRHLCIINKLKWEGLCSTQEFIRKDERI